MNFIRKFRSAFLSKKKNHFIENKFRFEFCYEKECHFYGKDLD